MNISKAQALALIGLGVGIALTVIGVIDHFRIMQLLTPIVCNECVCSCSYNLCV